MKKWGIVYNTGVDIWEYGSDRGLAHVHLGPCPACGARTYDYGGNWACVNSDCDHSPNHLTFKNSPQPDWWTSGIRVYLDGATWCAVGNEFVNTQSSPIGFGPTPAAAVEELNRLKAGQSLENMIDNTMQDVDVDGIFLIRSISLGEVPPGMYSGVLHGDRLVFPADSNTQVSIRDDGHGFDSTGPTYEMTISAGIRGTRGVRIWIRYGGVRIAEM